MHTFVADQTKTSESVLNWEQYTSDRNILNQIPFHIFIDETTFQEIESVYTMDETDTSVVYLRLGETNATVPESIFCLKHLEHLMILNMNFRNGVVPDTLENLQQLFVLIIYNTPISHMTDQLASLVHLRSVELEYCSLLKLPNLKNLPYLYELHGSYNRLSRIDGLNSIHRLYLDDNFLTEIPAMTAAEDLMYLSISSNPLRHWEELDSFIHLSHLYLSNTNMTSISSNIGRLQKLQELDLSGDKLSYLPRDIFELPELYLLGIKNNLFSVDEIGRMQTELNQTRPYLYLVA